MAATGGKPQAPRADRYALMGHPVSHSWSPFIHGMFAKQTGQHMQYRLIDVPAERFRADAVQFFLDGGRGLNVTVPHKQAAAELVNELTARAQRARAVNTISLRGATTLVGDNTDGSGLIADLTHNLRILLRATRVLILGAGGATRGVLAPLLLAEPLLLVIANRTPERARQLAQEFASQGPVSGCGFEEIDGGPFDLVINATSASLSGESVPLPAGVLAPFTVAYDMSYAKGETPFTRYAAQHGVRRAYRGWGMLVEQAAEAFLVWRGVRPQTKLVLELLTNGSVRQGG